MRREVRPPFFNERHKPRHDVFETRNGWSLFNAFTASLTQGNLGGLGDAGVGNGEGGTLGGVVEVQVDMVLSFSGYRSAPKKPRCA